MINFVTMHVTALQWQLVESVQVVELCLSIVFQEMATLYIVNRTCTVESSAMTITVIVPCKLNFNHCFNVTHNYNNRTGNIMDTFTITTIDYQPEIYTITFNYTDIYGQTLQATADVSLSHMCYFFNYSRQLSSGYIKLLLYYMEHPWVMMLSPLACSIANSSKIHEYYSNTCIQVPRFFHEKTDLRVGVGSNTHMHAHALTQ